jgi:hypothetical protein
MITTHDDISKRAREIWEREGRPEGRDKDHWLQAETELRQEAVKNQNGSNTHSEDATMLRGPDSLSREEGSRRRTSRRPK